MFFKETRVYYWMTLDEAFLTDDLEKVLSLSKFSKFYLAFDLAGELMLFVLLMFLFVPCICALCNGPPWPVTSGLLCLLFMAGWDSPELLLAFLSVALPPPPLGTPA